MIATLSHLLFYQWIKLNFVLDYKNEFNECKETYPLVSTNVYHYIQIWKSIEILNSGWDHCPLSIMRNFVSYTFVYKLLN